MPTPDVRLQHYRCGIRAVLEILWRRHAIAGSKCTSRGVAVGLKEVLRTGTSVNDLQYLVDFGLVSQRDDQRGACRHGRRTSRLYRRPRSHEQFRFALTEVGVAVCAALIPETHLATPSVPDSERRLSPSTERPKWDGRSLSLGDQILRQYPRVAPDQFELLDEFARQRWRSRIEVPTTVRHSGRLSEWLRNTVRNLNRGLAGIRFHCDGKGHIVSWEYVDGPSV